jgi:hypothetical protein
MTIQIIQNFYSLEPVQYTHSVLETKTYYCEGLPYPEPVFALQISPVNFGNF